MVLALPASKDQRHVLGRRATDDTHNYYLTILKSVTDALGRVTSSIMTVSAMSHALRGWTALKTPSPARSLMQDRWATVIGNRSAESHHQLQL